MAELADALDLGSSVFDVGVQVPLAAPSKYMREWLSGRALPCQGRYRGSESRLPLHEKHLLVASVFLIFNFCLLFLLLQLLLGPADYVSAVFAWCENLSESSLPLHCPVRKMLRLNNYLPFAHNFADIDHKKQRIFAKRTKFLQHFQKNFSILWDKRVCESV